MWFSFIAKEQRLNQTFLKFFGDILTMPHNKFSTFISAYAELQPPRVGHKARISGTVEEMLPPWVIE